jgi:hypothetical protein
MAQTEEWSARQGSSSANNKRAQKFTTWKTRTCALCQSAFSKADAQLSELQIPAGIFLINDV